MKNDMKNEEEVKEKIEKLNWILANMRAGLEKIKGSREVED